MENKRGKQYQRTHREITRAFIKLVKEKSFESVTIQAILDEALISKNTFYAHYRDKYDIAEQLFEQLKGAVKDQIETSFTAAGQTSTGNVDTVKMNSDAQEAMKNFNKKYADIYSALAKIKTDTVNMDRFVRDIFKEKYKSLVSAENRPDHLYQLEGDIYASTMSLIARHQLQYGNLAYTTTEVDDAACNAFLAIMRIIDSDYAKRAHDYIMSCNKEAQQLPSNYK